MIHEANISHPHPHERQGFETIRDTGTFWSLANDKSETKKKFMYSSFEGAEQTPRTPNQHQKNTQHHSQVNQNIDLSNIPSTQVKKVIKYENHKLPPTIQPIRPAPQHSFASEARAHNQHFGESNQIHGNHQRRGSNSILSRGMSPMVSRR